MAERFTIWDYCEPNILSWNTLFAPPRLKHLPIGFAPHLHRIEKPAEQDIDVLIYGAPSDSRFEALRKICNLGLSAMFVFGLYGAARDALIARSKIVLNINSVKASKIFSIVRASFLLANKKAVVADLNDDIWVEPDIRHAIAFMPADLIAQTCWHYIHNPEERVRLEEQGYAIMARRDIRQLLIPVLR
jgi:hypothetical protein